MKFNITNVYTERGELTRATGDVNNPQEAVIDMYTQTNFTIEETPCVISYVDSAGNIEFMPVKVFKEEGGE